MLMGHGTARRSFGLQNSQQHLVQPLKGFLPILQKSLVAAFICLGTIIPDCDRFSHLS